MAAMHPLSQYHDTIKVHTVTHLNVMPCPPKMAAKHPLSRYQDIIRRTHTDTSECHAMSTNIHCDNTTMPLLAHDLTHTALNVMPCPKSTSAKHPLWQYHNAMINSYMIWHHPLWTSRHVPKQQQLSIHCPNDNTMIRLGVHTPRPSALAVMRCHKTAKHLLGARWT